MKVIPESKTISKLLQAIIDVAKVDAIDLVICEECVHWKNCLFCYCDLTDFKTKPEDFCSYGERKEKR